jgi:hypothetical protein
MLLILSELKMLTRYWSIFLNRKQQLASQLLPMLCTTWAIASLKTLGYPFEFFLALNIFRKEGYALRLHALKERINWRWPHGWKL